MAGKMEPGSGLPLKPSDLRGPDNGAAVARAGCTAVPGSMSVTVARHSCKTPLGFIVSSFRAGSLGFRVQGPGLGFRLG